MPEEKAWYDDFFSGEDGKFDLGDAVDIGSLAAGLFGANESSNNADKQNEMLQASQELQNLLTTRSLSIADDAGASFDTNMEAFLEKYGNGSFNAEDFAGSLTDIGGARDEDRDYWNSIANGIQGNAGRYQSGYEDVISNMVAGMGGDMSATYDAQDVFGASTMDDLAFSDGNYDQQISDMAQMYMDNSRTNIDRATSAMMSKTSADSIDRGMGLSTYDIMARQNASESSARMYDDAVTQAFDKAIQSMSGRQGLDIGRSGAANSSYDTGVRGATTQFDMDRTKAVTDKVALADLASTLRSDGRNEYFDNIMDSQGAARGAMDLTSNDYMNDMQNAWAVKDYGDKTYDRDKSNMDWAATRPFDIRSGSLNNVSSINSANLSANSQSAAAANESAASSWSSFGDMFDRRTRNTGS